MRQLSRRTLVTTWFALGATIATESTATVALKAAQDVAGWYAVVAAGYLASFGLFAFCLRLGVRAGIAYGIRWAGVVALTAVVSAAVYDDEAVTLAIAMGVVLIVAGILAIKLGTQNSQRRRERGRGNNWVLLIRAGISEARAGTSPHVAERLTTNLWVAPIVGGYAFSFVAMSLALRHELAVGVAYAIWASIAVVLTAVLAHVVSRTPLTQTMLAGILLVAAAILILTILDSSWR